MWKGYIFSILLNRLEYLKREVERIYLDDPERIKGHPSAKLFIAIIDSIDEVLQNPQREEYVLGNTLGKDHRDWRRVKKDYHQDTGCFSNFSVILKKFFLRG